MSILKKNASVTRFNREFVKEFAILSKAIVYNLWLCIKSKYDGFIYKSVFKRYEAGVSGKYAFKVGLRLIHVAMSARETRRNFMETCIVCRAERIVCRLSEFRFLKYTACIERRNVSTISIAYAHNADCPFRSRSFLLFPKLEEKKKNSHAASGAPSF